MHKRMRMHILLTPTFALLVILGSGCGKAPNLKNTTVGKTGAGVATGTATTGTTPTDGSDSSGSASNGAPLRTNQIEGTGYTAYSFTVSTRSILKIKFAPGLQDRVRPGTGYTDHYSFMGVYIKVGTMDQPTPPLSNGYNPQFPAEASAPMDYSGAFTHTCASTDTACRQTVTITVHMPNNDDACLNAHWSCGALQHVPDGHTWNGTLTVQTDDTISM
jgi:hypothetical protein